MTKGERMFHWINERIAEGRTVYVTTALKATKVSPRTVASFKKDGHEVFKLAGGSCYMARGKAWDCIDFCRITAS